MSYKSDPKEPSIVPVENTALTVKSSALVRRGLKALASQELLMIRSPAERAPEPSRRPDEYKDGVAAYECGDYGTAFVKFMEAANRGYRVYRGPIHGRTYVRRRKGCSTGL
jgi:hypothetical protein